MEQNESVLTDSLFPKCFSNIWFGILRSLFDFLDTEQPWLATAAALLPPSHPCFI